MKLTLPKDGRRRMRTEDEAHVHVHFGTLPSLTPSGTLDWSRAHPGMSAKRAAEAAGKNKKEQDQAYRSAMIAYQDDLFEKVSKGWGHDRVGPRRARVSRMEALSARKLAETEATAKKMAVAEILFAAIESGDLIRIDLSNRRVGIASREAKARERIVDALGAADAPLLCLVDTILRQRRETEEIRAKLLKASEEQARQQELLLAELNLTRRRAEEIIATAEKEAAEIRSAALQEAAQQNAEREALNELTDAVRKGVLVEIRTDGLPVIDGEDAALEKRIDVAVEVAAPAAVAGLRNLLHSVRVFREKAKTEACRIGYEDGRARAKEIILKVPALLNASLLAYQRGDLVWVPPSGSNLTLGARA